MISTPMISTAAAITIHHGELGPETAPRLKTSAGTPGFPASNLASTARDITDFAKAIRSTYRVVMCGKPVRTRARNAKTDPFTSRCWSMIPSGFTEYPSCRPTKSFCITEMAQEISPSITARATLSPVKTSARSYGRRKISKITSFCAARIVQPQKPACRTRPQIADEPPRQK